MAGTALCLMHLQRAGHWQKSETRPVTAAWARPASIRMSLRQAVAPEMLEAIKAISARLDGADSSTNGGGAAPRAASETIQTNKPWWKFW